MQTNDRVLAHLAARPERRPSPAFMLARAAATRHPLLVRSSPLNWSGVAAPTPSAGASTPAAPTAPAHGVPVAEGSPVPDVPMMVLVLHTPTPTPAELEQWVTHLDEHVALACLETHGERIDDATWALALRTAARDAEAEGVWWTPVLDGLLAHTNPDARDVLGPVEWHLERLERWLHGPREHIVAAQLEELAEFRSRVIHRLLACNAPYLTQAVLDRILAAPGGTEGLLGNPRALYASGELVVNTLLDRWRSLRPGARGLAAELLVQALSLGEQFRGATLGRVGVRYHDVVGALGAAYEADVATSVCLALARVPAGALAPQDLGDLLLTGSRRVQQAAALRAAGVSTAPVPPGPAAPARVTP